MSKSLGNFFTIRDLLADWPGAVLRFQMLMTHYRQPIDWTRHASELAAATLDQFRALTSGAEAGDGHVAPIVIEALSDDLNTPLMIAELHRLMGEARKINYQAACDLRATCSFLGIDLDSVDVQDIRRRQRGSVDELKVSGLINSRNVARKMKNFKESDRIRDELKAMGIILKDGKDPKTGEPVTTWEIAR